MHSDQSGMAQAEFMQWIMESCCFCVIAKKFHNHPEDTVIQFEDSSWDKYLKILHSRGKIKEIGEGSSKIIQVDFFFFYFYLFVFVCTGSSLLHTGFLQLWSAGATRPCGVQASHFDDLS